MNYFNSSLIKQPSTASSWLTLIWLLACHSEGQQGPALIATPPRSKGEDPGWLCLKEGGQTPDALGTSEWCKPQWVWVKGCAPSVITKLSFRVLRAVHGLVFPCWAPQFNAIYFSFGESLSLIWGGGSLAFPNSPDHSPVLKVEKYSPYAGDS